MLETLSPTTPAALTLGRRFCSSVGILSMLLLLLLFVSLLLFLTELALEVAG